MPLLAALAPTLFAQCRVIGPRRSATAARDAATAAIPIAPQRRNFVEHFTDRRQLTGVSF